MSIRKAVYSLLSGIETNVFPVVAQQGTTDPYVVFSIRLSGIRTQDGISPRDVDLSLEIYANDLSDCIALADTMYAGLEAAAGTYATETLMICNWESETDFYVEDLKKYGMTQEYTLRFT